ncbi:MAG: hypothetical protein KCHDKBKB_03093 [Elusimicrobia bacterium]|nr:hypothetical protein [Elusimicrobiota bacterium]
MSVILLLVGLALLVVGGELLIRGSSRLASALGMPPLIIGLTIVAYGTSAPELSVSILASLKGQTDIALGNVVGSNIFNVLFILGTSALVAPLVVAQRIVRWDVPLMIAVSALLIPLSLNQNIGRIEGLFLIAGLVVFTVFVVKTGKTESKTVQEEYERVYKTAPSARSVIFFHALFILVGLGLLVLGTRSFVSGAVSLARQIGVSELIIGLTIVAAGTSLPEVVTSILATLRGEVDIAVGNVVGSNMFNILGVLGFSALFSQQGINVAPSAIYFDIPVMIAVAVGCLPIFFTGHRISRWEGVIFFLYYIAYMGFLILDARGHNALPFLSWIMFQFVIPMTILTLGIGVWRHCKLFPYRS